MTRLPGLIPGELDDDQRSVYNSIAGGDRAKDGSFPLTDTVGALVGPFNPLLYSPKVGDAIQEVGVAIRFHCELPAPVRELAILIVATHYDCAFERWAHEPIAKQVGLGDEQIEALRLGIQPRLDSTELDASYELCKSTLQQGTVDDAIYNAAVDRLGQQGVVELVALLGYYGLLAQLMNVFEVGIPE